MERQRDLKERNAALVALSEKEALISLHQAETSPLFRDSFVKIPLSMLKIDLVSELSSEECFQGFYFNQGVLERSHGTEAVVRLKTKSGHVLFLTMKVDDLDATKCRIEGMELRNEQ